MRLFWQSGSFFEFSFPPSILKGSFFFFSSNAFFFPSDLSSLRFTFVVVVFPIYIFTAVAVLIITSDMEAHKSFLSSRQGGGLGATREGTTTTTTTKKKEILKLCSESLHRRRFEDVLTLTSGLFKKKNKEKEKKEEEKEKKAFQVRIHVCLLYTSPSPRD